MLGTLLAGRYKIITILGAGGFGQTYLAEDTQESRRCVVKQFQPALHDNQFLDVARRLFHTEAQTLKRLGKHDQIPELYDFFEENEEFYLVQEYIAGHSLASELSRQHRLPENGAIALLRDVLEVLQFVHQHQVIHRDIKPGNLIRREHDGKIVLIDFGAVKEIGTQLSTSMGGMTSFTVGIGTQGYTPSEQLMGRPRFSSDIYALGMTAVQAVTGLSPSQLPDDPDTLEIQWKDKALISPSFEFVLDRMVRYDHTQRYPNVDDVLNALDKLAELPTNLTEVPRDLLLPESLRGRDYTMPLPPESWRQMVVAGAKAIAIAAVSVSGLLLGMRQLGWMEPLEVGVFDQMTRFQPTPEPDPRLLVVEITEEDLRALKRATPSDQTLANTIKTLQASKPQVIGLDLLRDLPQEPGQAELLKQLKANNVIAITKLGDTEADQIPPPPQTPPEQVGFNDFPIDADKVIRRNLLFASTADQNYFSFATRLALKYLAAQGIEPQPLSSEDPYQIKLGQAQLTPLNSTSGGYQNLDDRGYQILLRYRQAGSPARMVRLTDVLDGKVQPDWVQGKIVLIGTTAPSAKDLFYTPYSAGEQEEHQMAGVVVHAQMTSQLLSAALGEQPLFWYFPDWAEGLWIVGWAVVGGVLGWFVRNPLLLAGNTGLWLLVIVGGGFVLFTHGGWVPVVAPAIAFFLTDGGVAGFRILRHYRRHSLPVLWPKIEADQLTRTLPK
ncbi:MULTISPECIES: CHASE2 domain-containing protein [unclassified Leptolyngbya]|uniref:CHASE2 domain-containing protein n=1 Tax=unclassified Leptolyngbya TaxID=2650499 RepID=UPI001687DCB2|nr:MULTISPECIES: CHASE2 domain-containing protein [unclassified Leptolyngbya]MBD1911028.1 CHASE2 domain-containing protein [Leptolyngbya sp. FACHB-8]MBD2158306.1 CHASE2 domain-containing protein [Leptolyngbya sp. FACHB-16]